MKSLTVIMLLASSLAWADLSEKEQQLVGEVCDVCHILMNQAQQQQTQLTLEKASGVVDLGRRREIAAAALFAFNQIVTFMNEWSAINSKEDPLHYCDDETTFKRCDQAAYLFKFMEEKKVTKKKH